MTTSIYGQIIPENDQTQARRENLARLGQLVGNVYPNKFRRSNVAPGAGGEDTVTSVVREFVKHVPRVAEGARPSAEQLEAANAELNQVTVRVAGRLSTPPRVMGKAAFVHLSDGDERLQIYVRRQEAVAISNDSGAAVEEEESGWKLFQLLDHGDFAGVEGFLFVTKTGELSVHVRSIQFLSKALLPMPDKMHGISDPEVRQRQRYADLLASSLKIETEEEKEAKEDGDVPRRALSTREVFERRSKMIRELRRHLDDHGYIEVETPMLSPIASGAAARPFKTHHNALDIDLFARVAPELYLKRLLVGGFERVYELNRNFRNEGISTRHNPEFTMLEFYCAYMDADGMMDFCEELLRRTIKMTLAIPEDSPVIKVIYDPERLKGFSNDNPQSFVAKLQIRGKGEPNKFEFDFSRPFHRLTMKQAIGKSWLKNSDLRDFRLNGETFDLSWLDNPRHVRLLYEFRSSDASYINAKRSLEEDGLDTSDVDNEEVIELDAWRHATIEHLDRKDEPSPEETARQVIFLFEDIAEKNLLEPTFITDFPKIVSPLSKASTENPEVAERFELYIAGMECANGFSELNDPAEQLERFEEQARQRERGDEEAMQTDTDYVRALAYGMPPAAGIGIGVDRLAMLLTNRRSIRDVILFPHMRPRRSQGEEIPESDSGDAAREQSPGG